MPGTGNRRQCRTGNALNDFAGQNVRREDSVAGAGEYMGWGRDLRRKRGQIFKAADIGPGFPGGTRGAEVVGDNGLHSFG